MKAQVVITLDGQVSVITREGTFEEGRQVIETLLADLKTQGVDVQLTGPVEQHRHDEPGKVQHHVHTHTHS